MTLTAGPELDLAVAKACGFMAQINEHEMPPVVNAICQNGTLARYVFCPSADLNDAFLAAEKFGLFRPQRHGCLPVCVSCGTEDQEKWHILDDERYEPVVDDPLILPLAICAAILKLAEKP